MAEQPPIAEQAAEPTAEPTAPPPRRPRSAPDAVWAAARADYLAGLTAPEVCRRHGVGLTALRDRAAREGWRRVDLAWTAPNRLEPFDEGVALEDEVGGDLDAIDLCQLAWVAHQRMKRAVLRGQSAEALRWRKVKLMLEAEEAEIERDLAQQEALIRLRNDRANADGDSEAILREWAARYRPAAAEADAEADAPGDAEADADGDTPPPAPPPGPTANGACVPDPDPPDPDDPDDPDAEFGRIAPASAWPGPDRVPDTGPDPRGALGTPPALSG